MPAIPVPADRMLLVFHPLPCACDLGDVDYALLSLPGVASLDWEFNENRVWLLFIDDRRPSDTDLHHALETTAVLLKEIHRP